MTPQEFNNIFQDTIMELERLVSLKGKQYANEHNRLHNFDSAGHIDNESPIKACKGMWKKQLVSLLDAINTEDDYRSRPGNIPVWDQTRCDEVINDLLVYLILTKALFYRAYEWKPKSIPHQTEVSKLTCHHHRITPECSICKTPE
jgi:hypothetical protein